MAVSSEGSFVQTGGGGRGVGFPGGSAVKNPPAVQKLQEI